MQGPVGQIHTLRVRYADTVTSTASSPFDTDTVAGDEALSPFKIATAYSGSTTTGKADTTAAKVKKSGGKADAKLKAAAAKAMTQFLKAQDAVREAKLKVGQAKASAKKAVANAEAAAVIKASIVEYWCAVVNTLTASDSHFTDGRTRLTDVESCQVYVVPCLKCKGSACQCK